MRVVNDLLDKLSDVRESLQWGFQDLLSLGVPKKGINFSLGVDDELAYEKSPELYNFYMHLMEAMNEDPAMVETLLGAESTTRHQREQISERVSKICRNLDFIRRLPKDSIAYMRIEDRVNRELQKNVTTEKLSLDALLNAKTCSSTLRNSVESKIDTGYDTSKDPMNTFFKKKLDQLEEAKGQRQEGGGGGDEGREERVAAKEGEGEGEGGAPLAAKGYSGEEQAMDAVISEMQVDDRYSLDNENITPTDRFVFLAVTFVIRGITLYMLEWAINTRFITNFQSAFLYYFFIYNALFILFAMMVNMSDSLFFEMMFFYMSTKTHGIGRNLTHVLIQLILLPIPFLVKEDRFEGDSEVLSFEQRMHLQGSITQFSLFIWLFTSFIAFMY